MSLFQALQEEDVLGEVTACAEPGGLRMIFCSSGQGAGDEVGRAILKIHAGFASRHLNSTW